MAHPPAQYLLLVSCANAAEIGCYAFDTQTEKFFHQTPLPADKFAMPMAVTQDYVFVATRGTPGSIITYRIHRDQQQIRLTYLNQVPIEANLAYIQIHPLENVLIGASYGGDSLWVYDMPSILSSADHQHILKAKQTIHDVAHAHAVAISHDGRDIYVSALGADTLFCYQFQQHQLVEYERVPLNHHFGPRHLCFNQDATQLYVLSEFQGVVATFDRNEHTGKLSLIGYSAPSETLSHLKQGQARPNYTDPIQPDPEEIARWIWAADIQYNPKSQFLVVSERTSSQLIVHKVNEKTCEVLSAKEVEKQPRGFALSPCGHYLFVCGEQSAYLSAYQINQQTGELMLCARTPLFPEQSDETHLNANWITILSSENSL